MKVYISKYRDHWISPYTMLDYMFFWTDWSKCARWKLLQTLEDERREKSKYVERPDWCERWSDRLEPISRGICLGGVRRRPRATTPCRCACPPNAHGPPQNFVLFSQDNVTFDSTPPFIRRPPNDEPARTQTCVGGGRGTCVLHLGRGAQQSAVELLWAGPPPVGWQKIQSRASSCRVPYPPLNLLCACAAPRQALALELRQNHRILGRFVGRRRPGSKEVRWRGCECSLCAPIVT